MTSLLLLWLALWTVEILPYRQEISQTITLQHLCILSKRIDFNLLKVLWKASSFLFLMSMNYFIQRGSKCI